MDRTLVWFSLLVKMNFKKRVYMFQLIGLLLVLFIIRGISIPKSKNLNIGIYYGKSYYGGEITGKLIKGDSLFNFIIYKQDQRLQDEVLSGKIECGVVFSEEFDTRISNRDLQGAIVYYTTPLDLVGKVLEESVYASFLQVYSREILKDADYYIYDGYNENRLTKLLNTNTGILEGERVFQIITREVNTGKDVKGKTAKAYPVQGIMGLVILINMYLASGRKFDLNESALDQALPKKDRLIFNYLNGIAWGLFLGVIATAYIVFSHFSRGALKEIIAMLFLLFIGEVYVLVYTMFFKRELSYLSSIITLIGINIIICPIFFNLYDFIPILEYISYLSPLGIYLQ